jgi:hypothetical protein
MAEEQDTMFEQEEGSLAVRQANEWLNDHGRPSFDVLMDLARRHTAQAKEILWEYAERYDITHDPTMRLEDLVHRIWTAMESSPDTAA